MGYEPRRHSGMALNLTPLIDIVFLLLVFFMLTAHFIEEQRIAIELPEASHSQEAPKDGFVDVAVGADGALLVEGEHTRLEHLEQALRGALHAPDKHFVRLRGDQAAQLGIAVKVIDAARGAGAESMDILTKKP